jgi:cyanate permease
MVLAGLCVLGLSASLIAIPVMPECLEAIEDRTDLNYDPEEVNNLISGIFVTSTGVGETLGPIASSLLNKYFGFNLAQDYYAMFMMSYALMYIFLGGGRKILRSTETEKAKRQLSV